MRGDLADADEACSRRARPSPSAGTSCRCHCHRSTPPRWRSLPRCKSRGGGKPVVKAVIDEATPDKGPETEIKGEEENEAVAGHGAPGWLRLDGVAADILAIAALAADPITALVDTAFVGHIGSAQLVAVGASTSIFNLVSKLFNAPLLNVTTSFVAEQQAMDGNSNTTRERDEFLTPIEKVRQQKKVLPAVSTSLALATGIGLLEMVALIVGSGTLINIIGIPVDSPMRAPAEQFLTLRALGAPPIIVALAAQGAFRGFLDTRTLLEICLFKTHILRQISVHFIEASFIIG